MSRHPSAKGRRQPRANNEEAEEGVAKKWVDRPVMPTAKAQADQLRQKKLIEATEEYLGHPPQNEDLPNVMIVLPGKHMLLPELFEPVCFDAIRKAHGVWIVQEKPNIIRIHSRNFSNLLEAFHEINWTIHDLRNAQHHVSSLFLVQVPMNGECSIIVNLDQRPQASPRTYSEQLIAVQGNSHIVHGLMKELGPSFLSSADALQGRPEQILQMRVDFGHVVIRRRKKITQKNGKENEMHYTDFAKMTSQYGKRGGAEFEERLESGLASNVLRHLLQHTSNFFHSDQNLTFHESISIKLLNNSLEADIKRPSRGPGRLANVRLIKPDHCPPLKWTILAPDRKYDWCFRVDSSINLPIDPLASRLVKNIVINCDTHETSATTFLQNPAHVEIKDSHLFKGEVDQILLQSAVAIPFRDTPYVMDVSLYRVWKGVDTRAHPHQKWLSLVFHGVHWAAELNSVNANNTRKDWGVDQRHVWRGSAQTAEGQFEEFVSHVLEGLSALDGM
ncbi:hypothetical protein E4U42_003266 [Claviceps africana]|uniref:Uncharacterized protein n=1 Tax=Claviceps africana TaxID=83212 RepID=A0A8K0J766_9HYPO|nr:hypothetical protein E4U42_003266 [Claviceps africana]